MSHRIVEMLIGRLITDEGFRVAFVAHPDAAMDQLRDRGFDLSPTERSALARTDPGVWARAAEGVDPRLLKLPLPGEAERGPP